MLAIRNTGLVIFFILFSGFRLFFLPADAGTWYEYDFYATDKSHHSSEIHNTDQHCYYAVEVRNFSQTISEFYRFLSFSILSNRIVPPDTNFNEDGLIPVAAGLFSLVPIFIRGHALLN
jgi:hypothetical protein